MSYAVNIYTHVRTRGGDDINVVTDFIETLEINAPALGDSLEISDSFVVRKSQHKTLSDSIAINDSLDRHYHRHYSQPDSISLSDSLEKTITIGLPASVTYNVTKKDVLEVTDGLSHFVFPIHDETLADDIVNFTDALIVNSFRSFERTILDTVTLDEDVRVTITRNFQIIINDKVRFDDLEVGDSVTATFIGISVREQSDTIDATDFMKLRLDKGQVDAVSAVDAMTGKRLINRTLTDTIAVTDDTIVSRNAAIRTRTLSDDFTVIDRSFGSRIEHVQVSAEIIIGIEPQ